MPDFMTVKGADGTDIQVSHDWLRRWPEDYPEASAELKRQDDAAAAEQGLPVEPPREGRGSGDQAWIAYARQIGLEVDEDAKREDVWALIDAPQTPAE